MAEPWYKEFGSTFWLTLAGAFFAFGGVCLQAILKSRCKRFSCFGISCIRDPAPYGEEPELDLSSLEHGGKTAAANVNSKVNEIIKH